MAFGLPSVLLQDGVIQGFTSYRLSFLVMKKRPGFPLPTNTPLNENSFRTRLKPRLYTLRRKGNALS